MSSNTSSTPPEEETSPPSPPPPLAVDQAKEPINVARYDVEAWVAIANEAQSRPISEAAPVYEQLLATFPSAARYWKMYVEAQMAANDDDAVKQIFSRCLLNCLNVDLWRCYIRFMKKVSENRGPEGREEMKKAFEFMLGHLGMDIASGPVWMEYISFLKAAPALNPHDESQRMTSIRKAYQKAILVPIHLVEQLWKDYESFENSVSRTLAKGLLTEYQPKHFSARAVYRERKKYFERLDHSLLAAPPTGSLKEEQQCLAWKHLLAFEKGNPQRLDAAGLTKRVAFTHEQCLMYLYHYPDIWYDYATWHAENGLPDSAAAAVAIFKRALKALPDTSMLHYAFAEFEEARGSIEEAKAVYETLLRNNTTANALAYIQYMRFVRRTEGTEAARKVFLEARKAPGCTFHVYVASATMELCIDKDPKVARNIFELGLKKYIHEPAYVLEYADFLCRMNDDRNVRVLFERAMSVLPPEESGEVWGRFIQFEQQYGDLQSVLKVEQRRKEALSQDGDDSADVLGGSLQQLIARYHFLDLWPCSSTDLDHLARQQIIAKTPVGKLEKSTAAPASSGRGGDFTDRAQPPATAGMVGSGGHPAMHAQSNIVRPDISHMALYDPRQGLGGMMGNLPMPGLQMRPPGPPPGGLPPRLGGPPPLPPGRPPDGTIGSKVTDEVLKSLPVSLGNFLSRLPAVNGPIPDVEVVISVLLQAEIPLPADSTVQQPQQSQRTHNPGNASQVNQSDPSAVARPQPGANGSTRSGNQQQATSGEDRRGGGTGRSRQHQQQKRKEPDRTEEEEDTPAAQSRPPPRDVFRLRQLQRARVVGNSQASGVSGAASGGSGAYSGERSGSSE